MSVSVRTRFEVFKRDRFTCAYCGRTPPEVLLHVDHVVPRAAGGTDALANLITACATCNQGKAARMLEEGTAPVVGRATVEELQERVEQAKAYLDLVSQSEGLADRQVGMVIDAWAAAFGADLTDDGKQWTFQRGGYGELWPNEKSVRRFLRSMPLEDVLRAVDIASARMAGRPGTDATRYFYGICNRAIREGRPVGGPRLAPTYTLDSPEVQELEEMARRSGIAETWATVRDAIDDIYPTGNERMDALLETWFGTDKPKPSVPEE